MIELTKNAINKAAQEYTDGAKTNKRRLSWGDKPPPEPLNITYEHGKWRYSLSQIAPPFLRLWDISNYTYTMKERLSIDG